MIALFRSIGRAVKGKYICMLTLCTKLITSSDVKLSWKTKTTLDAEVLASSKGY
jgi:hypothetical protein